jgi:hypothetical protein
MEVQNHGLLFEDTVIRAITGISKTEYQSLNPGSYISAMDISKGIRSDSHYSIKVSKDGKSIGCGSLIRFMIHCRDIKFTMIVGAWSQTRPDTKTYKEIYEFDITPKIYNLLFGGLTTELIQPFVDYVNNIPPGKQAQAANKDVWKQRRDALCHKYSKGIVNIDAKIDSKTQRRVQCSIKLQDLIDSGIEYRKYTTQYQNINLPYEQKSQPRSFQRT